MVCSQCLDITIPLLCVSGHVLRFIPIGDVLTKQHPLGGDCHFTCWYCHFTCWYCHFTCWYCHFTCWYCQFTCWYYHCLLGIHVATYSHFVIVRARDSTLHFSHTFTSKSSKCRYPTIVFIFKFNTLVNQQIGGHNIENTILLLHVSQSSNRVETEDSSLHITKMMVYLQYFLASIPVILKDNMDMPTHLCTSQNKSFD